MRLAAKAPVFQGVEAREAPIGQHVAGLEEACREAGVGFVFGVDLAREPSRLAAFDRVVVASGAAYRAGLGPAQTSATGSTTRPAFPPGRRSFAWPGQTIIVIGDADRAGTCQGAITQASEAALLGRPVASS